MTGNAPGADTIQILGAGPAGLTAAIILARAGRTVTVLERASTVGARSHGDYQALENWSTHENLLTEFTQWGLSDNFHCIPMHALTCFGPGFKSMERLEDSNPLFYVFLRGSKEQTLDSDLLSQAYAAGVRIEFLCSAPPEKVDIVATGLQQVRAYALGYNFTTKAPDACYVCLDAELTPNCYSYLIICEGRGTVAFVSLLPLPLKLKRRLDLVVAGFRSQIGFSFESPRPFAGATGWGLPQTSQKNGRLYVGEAAGMLDPLFGFGVRMGMTTGYLAARSILEGHDYDSFLQAHLMPQFRAGAVHRLFFQMTGNIGYQLLLRYMRLYAHGGRDLFVRHFQPLWYARLFWPLAQQKLLSDFRRIDAYVRKSR